MISQQISVYLIYWYALFYNVLRHFWKVRRKYNWSNPEFIRKYLRVRVPPIFILNVALTRSQELSLCCVNIKKSPKKYGTKNIFWNILLFYWKTGIKEFGKSVEEMVIYICLLGETIRNWKPTIKLRGRQNHPYLVFRINWR